MLFFEFSVQHQVQSDEVAASAAEIADRRGVVRGFYDRAYVGQVEEVFDTYVQAQERGQLLRDGDVPVVVGGESPQVNFALFLVVRGRVFVVIVLLALAGVFVEETDVRSRLGDMVTDGRTHFGRIAELGQAFIVGGIFVVASDQRSIDVHA